MINNQQPSTSTSEYSAICLWKMDTGRTGRYLQLLLITNEEERVDADELVCNNSESSAAHKAIDRVKELCLRNHLLEVVEVQMVLTHQPICGEDLSAHKLAVAMAHNNPGHGKEPGICLFWLCGIKDLMPWMQSREPSLPGSGQWKSLMVFE